METKLQDCETKGCLEYKPRDKHPNPTPTRIGFCSWCWSDIVKIRERVKNG